MLNSTNNTFKWQARDRLRKVRTLQQQQTKVLYSSLIIERATKNYTDNNSNNNIYISTSNDHHNGLTKNNIHNEINK